MVSVVHDDEQFSQFDGPENLMVLKLADRECLNNVTCRTDQTFLSIKY